MSHVLVVKHKDYNYEDDEELTRQKIHEAEILDKACAGKTYTLEEILDYLESDKKVIEDIKKSGAVVYDFSSTTTDAIQETRDIMSGKIKAKRYNSVAEAIADIEE